MIKNIYRLFVGMLLFSLVFVLVACNSNNSSSNETDDNNKSNFPNRLTLGSAASGTTYFVVGAALSQVLEAETGIKINMETSGGSSTNIQLIEQGDMGLGLTVNSMAAEGWTGDGWAEGETYQKIRAIIPVLTNYLHIYTLSGNEITSIHDLSNKNVATGSVGTSSEVTGNQIIELFNINANRVVPLPTDQAVDGMKDGTIDVGFSTVGLPGPFMQDLETTHNPTLIPLSDDEMNQILTAYPYYSAGVIPSRTYKNQNEDIKAISYANFLIASVDLDDDVVYEITKKAFENKEKLIQIHPSLEALTLEGILDSSIPIHPGAVRYYEENGVQIPEELKR